MVAKTIAARLFEAGFQILSFEEGGESEDGEVKVHPKVHVQVPTFGVELTVNREEGEGDAWCVHHGDLRTDFKLLCKDIRRAIVKANAN